MQHQWMIAERRNAKFRLRIDREAVLLGAFDEQRHDRRGDIPAAALNRAVENTATRLRRRQKLHVIEAPDIHAEPARVFEKQLGVRPLGDEAAGLLLEKIL